MEYLEQQIRKIASELILDALENGDAIAVARDLRRQVIAGWNAALTSCGVPDDHVAILGIRTR